MIEKTSKAFWTHRVPSDAPDDYKKNAYRSARREASVKLYDLLWERKTPAVVEIEEEITRVAGGWHDAVSFNGFCDEIRIYVNITPVAHRDAFFTHGHNGPKAHISVSRFVQLRWKLRQLWRRWFA
jgi:hypothetical protein